MRYIDLFAGIGGFALALNRLGHECVYTNEWDKYAAQIYEKNFKVSVDRRSITDVSTESIPDHDLLVGGFPCQAFSIAGKRRGFDETRGTLFFDVARILKDKKPSYFILENVKGLLSHDAGRTIRVIIYTLTQLGYDVQWQVLNSKDWGVPQNRERIYIVGHLRGEPRPKIFPLTREVGEITQARDVAGTLQADYWKRDRTGGYVIEKEHNQDDTVIAPTVRATYHKRGDNNALVGTLRTHKEGNGFREIKAGVSPTIPARARQDGSGQPVIVHRTPLKFMNRNQKNIEGDYSYTVDTAHTGGVSVNGRVRLLTPIECERLQGFPDNWTAGVSDTQRYKQLGNAVTVNVVEAVAKYL